MLQTIRDRSQGWLAGVIVFLVIGTFALWGIHSYLSSGGSQTDTVAKVNGKPISQNELNVVYERLRQQQQMQLGADFVLDQKTEMQLKRQALNQIIIARVLSQAAVKDGFRITMPEIEGALLSIPAFQVNGRFSRERFNDVINSTLYTEKSFLDDLQTSMLINQVRGGYISSAFALPEEVATAVKLINQKRDIGYLIVPASRFNSTVQIDDNDAKLYYQQHQEQFTAPEQVSIQYLQLSLPQIAANLHFTEDQIQQSYQNNIATYTSPQRWHVAHILVKLSPDASSQEEAAAKARIDDIANRIKAGQNFAKLAKTYSDDMLSADKGGMLDWFSAGMVDPTIEKAVANLKVGEVTNPVRTKYGYDIIKLVDVQKPVARPLNQVRDQIVKSLAQQQAEQVFADSNDKLSNLTYSNPGSLEAAAKALGLQVKTSGIFDKRGGKDDITGNPKVIAAAFSPDVLQGNNSDVIELSPDNVIVIRVDQHKPTTLKPFNVVREQVIQVLKKDATKEKAKAFGENLLQQLRQGKSGQQIAAQGKVKWQDLNNIGRYNTQAPAPIVTVAFRMPRPGEQQPLSTAGFSLPTGDFAIVQLKAVHDGQVDNASIVQQRVYREGLESNYGQLDYGLYVKDLMKKAKIVYTNKDLASPNGIIPH